MINEKPGISLERLLNLNLGFEADDIYHLLAKNEIYADIKAVLVLILANSPFIQIKNPQTHSPMYLIQM